MLELSVAVELEQFRGTNALMEFSIILYISMWLYMREISHFHNNYNISLQPDGIRKFPLLLLLFASFFVNYINYNT